MKGKNLIDNRLFTRVEYTELVSVCYENQVFLGEIKNVSLQGLFIVLEHKIPRYAPFDVMVVFSSDESIILNASVVRCGKTGICIQIKHMDMSSFFHLRTAVGMQCKDLELIIRETCMISSCIH
jgi:DNA-directed RNA polymerase subunit E'/Rpb7